MSNKIFLISLFFLLACGRVAERIKVESVYPPISSINTVLAKELKNKADMRSSSIVLYPNPSELQGMSFDPVGPSELLEESGWIQVISKLSYGNRLPRGFSSGLDNKEKVLNAVRIILSVSDARDLFFKQAGQFQKDLDRKQKEIDQMQGEMTSKYICYYPVDNESGHTCEIASHPGDTAPIKEIAENCNALSEWVFKFTGDDLERFKSEVQSCVKFTKDYKKMRADVKKNKIAPLNELRKLAKGIVTDMLKQMELFNKQRYLLTAATNEDPANDDTKSQLIFNEDGNEIKLFQIYLDSGSDFKMYSLENGGIQKLKWFKNSDGIQVLSFSLVDEKFSFDAELAASTRDIFDLRFVGDIVYKEGNITRRGVMKMEFDF